MKLPSPTSTAGVLLWVFQNFPFEATEKIRTLHSAREHQQLANLPADLDEEGKLSTVLILN